MLKLVSSAMACLCLLGQVAGEVVDQATEKGENLELQVLETGIDKLMGGREMKRSGEELGEMRLVGISVRTNNEAEANRMTGKILPVVMDYFHRGIAETIPNRKRPGVTICAYTDYESDCTGGYTYFIGEEVTGETELPEGLERRVVPAQHYAKFTTEPAPMPDVVVNAWQAIWQMGTKDLGGERSYRTDFELYDERAADESNAVLDLYVGIESLARSSAVR